MTLRNKTFQPLFAALSSVALVACLWMVGCSPAADKEGPDGTEPAAEADDHEHDGEDHDHDGEEHDHDGEEHDHGDEEKGGDDEESPTDPGPKVDPAADDLKAGEPSFPKLPE